MNNSQIEQTPYQEDEIDLKQLFKSLAERRRFIFGFTSFVTALAIVYALSIPPTYKANISFLSPSNSSVIELNKIKLTSETSETIYREFLNKAMSSQLQWQVFYDNDYISRLNPDNETIENLDNFFHDFVQSLTIEEQKIQKNVEKANYEKPVNLSLEGTDSVIISDYLNDLAKQADKSAINEFLTTIELKIALRLMEIDKQKELLLSRAKQDRLAKIKRIKEEDGQKINEINDQINRLRIKAKNDRLNEITKIEKANLTKIEKINEKIKRLRVKAKNNRLNKIQILSDAATIAAELGIIENNFKKISNNKFNNSDLTIAIGDNQKLPQWYLYGEKALLKEIQTLKNRENDDPYISEIVTLKNEIDNIENDKDLLALKNRVSDDPYIPEIVNLQNKLNEINSNQTLQTLEKRKDDSPFIAEINKLDIEAIRLRSFEIDDTGIHAMQVNQQAFVPESPIKPKKKLIVAVAAIAGFIFSILLVFIMNAFRDEKS